MKHYDKKSKIIKPPENERPKFPIIENERQQVEYIIVPQSDIDNLEIARKKLFEIIKNDAFLLSRILTEDVSEPMWKLTHRKYEKYKPIKNNNKTEEFDCCQKALTTYIIKEAMLMKGSGGGDNFASKMLLGAGISTDNPDDMKILKEIGQEAIDMINYFFPPEIRNDES